jgi:hypothetical protein
MPNLCDAINDLVEQPLRDALETGHAVNVQDLASEMTESLADLIVCSAPPEEQLRPGRSWWWLNLAASSGGRARCARIAGERRPRANRQLARKVSCVPCDPKRPQLQCRAAFDQVALVIGALLIPADHRDLHRMTSE